jgi:hypothetical protein
MNSDSVGRSPIDDIMDEELFRVQHLYPDERIDAAVKEINRILHKYNVYMNDGGFDYFQVHSDEFSAIIKDDEMVDPRPHLFPDDVITRNYIALANAEALMVPVSKEHAERMILLAEAYLKTNDK